MSQEVQIAQILGTIPNLTPAQIDSLSTFNTAPLLEAEQKAESTQGYEVERRLAVVSNEVAFGVFVAARLAVLGVLAGDSTLTEPWTSIVGDFQHEVSPVSEFEAEVESTDIPAQAPAEVAPTVEAVVDAPVTETPAPEVPPVGEAPATN